MKNTIQKDIEVAFKIWSKSIDSKQFRESIAELKKLQKQQK